MLLSAKLELLLQRIEGLKFPGVICVLVVLGFVAYANAIFHPFVHDDVIAIQNASSVAHLDLLNIFRPSHVSGMVPYYRPFIEAVYQIQHILFGKNPYIYHFFNVILHITNSILVYFLLHLLLKHKTFALGIAILFLVHPVQTEAVAAIAGITNLLFSLFCILTFIGYVQITRRPLGRRDLRPYILSLAAFTAALLTKEPAIMLPFLIVLYEICFPKTAQIPWPKRCQYLAGILIVALTYLLLRKLMLGTVITGFLANREEFYLRVLAIPQSLLTYLRAIFFPVDLHYYRSTDILSSPFEPTIILLAVGAAAFFLARLAARVDLKIILFGLGWFFVALIPTLNILPLIIEYSSIFTSEHFLYFPMIGMALSASMAVKSLLQNYFKEKSKQAVFLIFTAIAAIFIMTTIRQNTYWRGEISLFERTLRFEKNLGRVHILLARAYYFNKEFEKAIKEYFIALGILQRYVSQTQDESAKKFYLGFIKEIYFDLAHCHEAQNDFTSAIKRYHQAIGIDSGDPILYNNLAACYLRLHKINEAAGELAQALSLDPGNVTAMNNLALCHIYQGEEKEARLLLEKALTIDSQYAPARQNLEKLLKSGEKQ